VLKTTKYWLKSGEKHPEKINKEIPVKIFFYAENYQIKSISDHFIVY